MNFLRNIVDGILADDLSEDREDSSLDPTNFNRKSDLPDFDNPLDTDSPLYNTSKQDLQNLLMIKYGKGCVKHLSDLLKTNANTVDELIKRWQIAVQKINTQNGQLEQASVQMLRLQKERDEASEQLEQILIENCQLKGQVKEMESRNQHMAGLVERLKEVNRGNAETFARMKMRCKEFVRYKSEMEALEGRLRIQEEEMRAMRAERDRFWGRAVGEEDIRNQLATALDRCDRSVAVAKLLATHALRQTTNTNPQTEPQTDQLPCQLPQTNQQLCQLPQTTQHQPPQIEPQTTNQQVGWQTPCQLPQTEPTELQTLRQENANLRDVNQRLAQINAELSKSKLEAKSEGMRESFERLVNYLPQRVDPIQLIFIEPTGVLDLEVEGLGNFDRYQVPPAPSLVREPQITANQPANEQANGQAERSEACELASELGESHRVNSESDRMSLVSKPQITNQLVGEQITSSLGRVMRGGQQMGIVGGLGQPMTSVGNLGQSMSGSTGPEEAAKGKGAWDEDWDFFDEMERESAKGQ